MAFWSALGIPLIALFLSFRAFVIREVAWAYPANYDQTKYLWITYSAFEVLLREGPRRALAVLLRGAYENGILIHLEALLLFVFFGASRVVALTVNYLHLVIYVTVFAWAVKGLTGSRRLAFLAFGLALGSGPFWFGTLIDYRLDFSASCVFGIFVSTVMHSRIFRSLKGSLAAGAVAGIMMLTRFLSSLYLGGIYALLAAYFLGRIVLGRGNADAQIRLNHLAGSGMLALAVASPMIWLSRVAIYNYYVVQQGKEIAIRALEFPSGAGATALLYYPRSLLAGHVGASLAWGSVAVLGLAVAVGFRRGIQRRPVAPAAERLREPYIFLLACAAVILGTLTANITRSPVVVGILVPVFSWAVVLTFFACLRPWLAAGDRLAQQTCAWAAGLAFALGLGSQVVHFDRHLSFMQQRMDVSQIVDLYDAMGSASERAGWGAPVVASDSMRDYFVAGAPLAVYYERHGAMVTFVGVLGCTGSVNALPRDVMLAQLAQANFLILTHRRDVVEPPYPVVTALEEIRPDMEAFARTRLTHLGRYKIFDRQVDLYARP